MQMLQSRRDLIAAGAAFLVAAAATAPDQQAVIAPIQNLVDGLLRVMKAGMGTSFAQRFDTLAPVIDGTFDLPAILQEAVGVTWPTLPADQQTLLAQAFRRYTVASYVNSFNQFDGQRFEVKPETRTAGDAQIVQTRIIPRSGDSHELDYVMREAGQGWRAVDVLADGAISRVAVERSDFRRLIARGGAVALAESLQAKFTKLSGGPS
jgi:phospholipid transport system substrate-binding protein